jgi:hypothetical protein
MDSVERKEARETAVKKYWAGLAEKLKECVCDFNRENLGSKWTLNDTSKDCFNVAKERIELFHRRRREIRCLYFRFTWDPVHEAGKIEVYETEVVSGEVFFGNVHQIVVNSDGEPFLIGSDGVTRVSGEETAGKVLEQFLEKYR